MEYKTYLIIKSIHIMFVIFWMAGMLYLPRLFAYHVKHIHQPDCVQMLITMQKRLISIIINPAMIVSLATGLILFVANGAFSAPVWLHIKFSLAMLMIGMHGFFSSCRKKLLCGTNQYSEKFYRIINEVPAILVIAIILVVTLKNL